MMGVLMFFFFASQVFYVFGKVIVIREPYKEDEAKLTCFSEDDGGALVWNDVISKKFMEKLRKTRKSWYNKFLSLLDIYIDTKVTNYLLVKVITVRLLCIKQKTLRNIKI